jgi:hypothetical protein
VRATVGIAAVLLCAPGAAAAQEYTLDLHSGAALGSVRIVGMGGTVLATAEGTAGTLANPASAAVRRTTSQGSWDWDFHVDYLSERASDFDNNGAPDAQPDSIGPSLLTYGLGGMLHGWGLAVAATEASTTLGELEASASQGKVAVARELLDQRYTVGAAFKIGSFRVLRDGVPLFELTGAGLELGGLWRPPYRSFRVGAAIAFPISGDDVEVSCEPDCPEPLPSTVAVPWQLAVGGAWRRAPTVWNQQIPHDYRDERALLVAADLIVTGPVRNGYGLQGFGDGVLQRSGTAASVSVRAGVEYEWLPGRLRVRGGSYWEPGRIEGVGGRIHGTFGVEGAIFQFRIWSWTFRPRLSLTGDVAARYANGGASVGFWH